MTRQQRAFERRQTRERPTRRHAGARDARASRPSGAGRPSGPWLAAAAISLALVAVIALQVGGSPGTGASSPSPSRDGPSAALPTVSGAAASDSPAAPTAPGPGPIAGIPCDVDEKTAYHLHAHLNIRFDGVLQPIPDDVGRRPTCLYWLHTHATYGVIHVEAPAPAMFTLGQFFDVWGQSLDAAQVAGRQVGTGESIFVFVDRAAFDGDPRTIVLGNLVAIEIQVGTAPLEPLPYVFPPEFQ